VLSEHEGPGEEESKSGGNDRVAPQRCSHGEQCMPVPRADGWAFAASR
jgi:hypothetical protein